MLIAECRLANGKCQGQVTVPRSQFDSLPAKLLKVRSALFRRPKPAANAS